VDAILRDALPGDQDAIREVTLAAYQQYAALMPAHWDAYRQDILSTLADVKPAAQIVAEQRGTVVGAVLLYPAGTVWGKPDDDALTLEWPEVRLLAVASAVRGQGIGRALLRDCLRRARLAGASSVTLHTTDMMRVAQGMYERMGFVRAPALDYHPAPDVTIKGYRYLLQD
jgi:ribosomal protein S18 acetylase RimI-like enzyme